MRPVLLVRNDEHETFGVAPGALAWAGCDIRTVNMTAPGAELPPLDEVAAVVMFGGTANADETERLPYLGTVRDLAREAVERGIPFLGICLGSQVLARAFGRPVVRAPVREVGFEPIRPTADAARDPLLSLYADGDVVVQWHEDTFELPEGATLLATGDDVATQAYRVGELAWGIQFHQEVDAATLGWWIRLADEAGELPDVWGKTADELRAESERFMPAHEERGRALFGRFAEVALARGRPPGS